MYKVHNVTDCLKLGESRSEIPTCSSPLYIVGNTQLVDSDHQFQSINQGLFSIQTNNNNNIHTFVYMNTERAGNEVKLLV